MATDDNQQAPDPKEKSPRDDDAWIERVVDVAGNLGFNKMRLRWKLLRWQEGRRKKARARAQVLAHITYAHKTCRECGAVQDRDEAICTRCGAALGRRGVQVLERVGLAMPVAISMSTLLALAILAAYGRVWIASGGGLGAPSGPLLLYFGARWPPLIADEPWRLVTAMFLHAGLWHLGFNILAIASIGPRIEEIYGRTAMLALFILTGAVANLAAVPVAPYTLSVGASGGVMGLIGVAAAYGHRSRTGHGRALRDDMLKWVLYTFILGFAVRADHWAHLFGLLTGLAFGALVKPTTWSRPALLGLRALAGFLALLCTVGAVAIICARTPPPPDDPDDPAPADTRPLDDGAR